MAKTIKKVIVKTTKQPKSITAPQKAVYANPTNYTKNGKRMISPAVDNVADAEKYDMVLQEVVYVNTKHDITEKVLKILNSVSK